MPFSISSEFTPCLQLEGFAKLRKGAIFQRTWRTIIRLEWGIREGVRRLGDGGLSCGMVAKTNIAVESSGRGNWNKGS